jgi:TRAP-type C4-dicarboxylate transport system permease small subunit
MRQATLTGIARLSMALAGVSLVALVVLVGVSVAMRLAGSSLPSADDLASVLLAGTFCLGFAAAVASRDHIRVLVFVRRLPAWPGWGLAVLVELASVAVVGWLLSGLWRIWMTALMAGTMSLGAIAIPKAVPIGVVAAGVALLELALILQALGVLANPPGPGRPDPWGKPEEAPHGS